MIVLESFPAPAASTNPYIVQLADGLSQRCDLRTFTWRRALTGRVDLFHVHWPERLVRGSTPPRTFGRRLAFCALLARLAVTRTPVVRTLHNLEPHEGSSWVERHLLGLLDRLTSANVLLNAESPRRTKLDRVILHGDYRDWFARYPRSERVPDRIAYAGLIRPYKGVIELVDAFAGLDGGVTLTVSGKVDTEVLREALHSAAHRDPRLALDLRYVDDARLVHHLTEAEVVVLPYREVHNSGVALLALSLDRPVLITESASTSALAEEVGQAWVMRFTHPLSAADLRAALDGAHALVTSGPDLSQRSWAKTVEQHLELFELLCSRPARS